MKLLFIILAHNHPEHVAELAATLVAAASDGRVIIHFDASAKPEDYTLLRESLKENGRVAFTERRIRCLWGDYSLVDATLTAMAEARAQGHEYDYALLLSGSCLPCRPIRQLERYLTENRGKEFIEANGPEWITDGLREERYAKYSIFPSLRTQRASFLKSVLFRLEDISLKIQRKIRVDRRLPAGISIPRFGSQWWCLTWRTCLDILDFLKRNPAVERFYRKTWIPDEMFFSTLVHHFVNVGKLAGYNLTHYHFTDYGKPVVFYDDHGEYPFQLNKFFYRKVSAEAKTLRRRSLEQAREPDSGETLKTIGAPNRDYAAKVKTQTHNPVPGHIFYRDQLADTWTTVLKQAKKPYVVVCASLEPLAAWDTASILLARKDLAPDAPLRPMPEPYMVLCESLEITKAMFGAIDPSVFEFLGRPFMPGAVDFGLGRESFHGLKRGDVAIRDLGPALYFARILKRSEKIPVFLWMPGDNKALVDTMRADSRSRLREIRLC